MNKRPLAQLSLQLRMSSVALSILRRRLGVAATTRLLFALLGRMRRGEPWQDLEPPDSARERASRDEIGQALVLYDLLCARSERATALDIIGELVREAAVLQLGSLIPPLSQAMLAAMPQTERHGFLQEIVERFPNAIVDDLEVDDDAFRYRVVRCHLAELCVRTGRSELAPLFCAGDALYFERHVPEVRFERPGTIAEGHDSCDFSFVWRNQ